MCTCPCFFSSCPGCCFCCTLKDRCSNSYWSRATTIRRPRGQCWLKQIKFRLRNTWNMEGKSVSYCLFTLVIYLPTSHLSAGSHSKKSVVHGVGRLQMYRYNHPTSNTAWIFPKATRNQPPGYMNDWPGGCSIAYWIELALHLGSPPSGSVKIWKMPLAKRVWIPLFTWYLWGEVIMKGHPS